MRRAAPWLLAAAGVLLAALSVVLVSRGDRGGGLVFLSPEQYDQLLTARRRVGTGRLVWLAGTVLLGVAVGRSWVRRSPGGRCAGVVLGLVGIAVVVLGWSVVRSAESGRATVYSASNEPAVCPGGPGCGAPSSLVLWAGAGSALAGGLLLGSVSGRWPGGGRRADQQ